MPLSPVVPANLNVRHDIDTVKVGINYRFWSAGPGGRALLSADDHRLANARGAISSDYDLALPGFRAAAFSAD